MKRRKFASAAIGLLILCALIVEVRVPFVPWIALTAPARAATGTTQPTTRPVAFAPITYFETNCANCHGPYGNAYGDAFGKGLSDPDLSKMIDDMAHGPGNAPVDATQLQVLVNYHKAMIAKRPFVIVNAIEQVDDQAKLSGEVTPTATVTVNRKPATVDDHTWSATAAVADAYDVIATHGEQTTSLRVGHPSSK
jgi:cytochrome c553